MSPEQALALVQIPEAELAAAAEHLRKHEPLRTRLWLDRSYSSETSLAILDCAVSRAHFAAKLEKADRWLLTREAAEQATPSRLALWRSDYLRERFPQAQRLVELGTGIGGDTVFLARNFAVDGYERDAARASLARANVGRLSPQARQVLIESREVTPAELSGGLLFADPARRAATRKFDPESWEPPLSALLSLSSFGGLVVKTAPGLDLGLLPPEMEVHFLSLAGELKEAMLLLGGCGAQAKRHAWLWSKDDHAPLHRWGPVDKPAVREPEVGQFLHAPDPALLRSGLLGQLALELEAGVVHPKIGYLSGPRASTTAWAASFAIRDVFALNWQRLGEALRLSGWADFEYLGRGVPFSQADVLSRVKKAKKAMTGHGRGAVIIYRDESDYRVVIGNRI